MNRQKLLLSGLLTGLLLMPVTGCVSRVQTFDFVRTEFARVTADMIGQAFLILVQAISPFSAA